MDSSQCCGLVACARMLGCWLWTWSNRLWSQWKTFNFSEWAVEVFWGTLLCQPIWKYQWEQRRGEVQFPVSTERREREFYFLLLFFFKKHLPKVLYACHHMRKWTGFGIGDGSGERRAVWWVILTLWFFIYVVEVGVQLLIDINV